MKRNRFHQFVLAIWLSVTASCFATQIANGAGQTEASFLALGAGARIEAMAGAGTAIASGVDATYWNAASLGRRDGHSFSFSHGIWFADISYEHLGFIYPLSDRACLALSSSILHTAGIPRTFEDPYGLYLETDGSFSYTAMTVCASMGREIAEDFFVGGSAKFLYEDNAAEGVAGTAFDVSALYVSPEGDFSLGVAARHLGSGLKDEHTTQPLPSEVALGIAVALADSNLIACMDGISTADAGARFSWGMEHRLRNVLFLRGGYTLSTQRTAHRGFTVGAGTRVGGFSIDYSASDFQELGLVHRFSVGIGGS